MAGIFRRFRRLRQRAPSDVGDVDVGDAVRVAWGGPLGWVKSVSLKDGVATVHWHNQQPGHCEIISIKYLRRASADPAFGPDVRNA